MKNIEHLWTIPALSSSIDGESNRLSVFNILEQFTVNIKSKDIERDKDKAKNIPINFQLVSLWAKTPQAETGNAKLKIKFLDPTEKELLTFEHTLNISKEHQRIRSRININGIPVTISGNYFFEIYLDEGDKENKVGIVPINITIKEE